MTGGALYEEELTRRLRELYESYGYERFFMNKFEEYDLYSENKRFLTDGNILTFTDKNGKLMALKPDITLSIVKNQSVSRSRASCGKYYYRESVYRTRRGEDAFSEIMQTGVECVGSVDTAAICEVILMALESLSLTGERTVLEISSMGILEGMLSGVSNEYRHEIIKCVSAKNAHGTAECAAAAGLDSKVTQRILQLFDISSPISVCCDDIMSTVIGDEAIKAAGELCRLRDMLKGCGRADEVYFDISLVYDRMYYTGVVFRGFADGVPERILSGGHYDGLAAHGERRGEGVGFALYTDPLMHKRSVRTRRHVDMIIEYAAGNDIKALVLADKARADGKSVYLCRIGDECDIEGDEKVTLNGEVGSI